MRVNNVFSGRPQWYDRNPLTVYNTYNATTGPGSATVRWTYTVPSNRKAQAELVMCRVRRATAATTPGNAESFQQWGVSSIIMIAEIDTNAVGDKDNRSFSAASILVAGEVAKGVQLDLSTGGTCDFTITGKLTEFDA